MRKQHFSVVLNDEAVQRVRHFNEGIDVSHLSDVDIAISYFFSDSATVEALMNGYREMASLNQEITKAFTPCEVDADVCLSLSKQILDEATLG